MTAPTIDPEFRDLLPPLTDEEISELRNDLKSRGCLYPVLVWDGVLVEGHHRFSLCLDLGIACPTKPISFGSRDECIEWILSHSLSRRNLSPRWREEIVGKLYLARKRAGRGDGSGSTANKVAEEASVSPSTVRRAAKRAEVRESLTPELRKAILDGRAQCDAKTEEKLIELSDKKQKAIARKAKKEPVNVKDELQPPPPEEPPHVSLSERAAPYSMVYRELGHCLTTLQSVNELGLNPELSACFERLEFNLTEVRAAVKMCTPVSMKDDGTLVSRYAAEAAAKKEES